MNGRLKEGGCRLDDIWNNFVFVVILDMGCDFSLDEFKDFIVGDNIGDIFFLKRVFGIVGWEDFGDELCCFSDFMVDKFESCYGIIMV